MATLTLENVHVRYAGGALAVRNFNLSVADGEFVVLVGPSGCGKSTVLRAIAGLEPLEQGRILLDGRDVSHFSPGERNVAMVFQNYALYPHMTAYENMALALRLRGLSRAEIDRRVRHAADILALSDLLARKPGQLSGGQRQRVAVGRAIVREPHVFLFDEPLSNLDARLRATTRAELKTLHQRLRTTAIYVTHDQEEAMTLGDRVVVMDRGMIQQIGTPLDTYQHPRNRFVATFVGTPPMNLCEGTIESRDMTLWFRDNSGILPPIRVPPSQAARLNTHTGRHVLLGLRPTAFVRAESESTAWAATVRIVEPLGDAVDLRIEAGGIHWTVRLPADGNIRPDDRIHVRPIMEQAHWFAIDSGLRIE
jgi:ABC-type sugar transport system ATPase subunit